MGSFPETNDFCLLDREGKMEALLEPLPAFEVAAAPTSALVNLVFLLQTVLFSSASVRLLINRWP